MPSQSPHPDKTPVVRNIASLPTRQNQQNCGRLGNSQLPPAKRHVSVPAGERDSSQGGSSVASIIQGQNSTHTSSLNSSRVADLTQHVSSTLPTTLWWSINIPTPILGPSRPSTPAPIVISQTDSTCCVVSSPTSCIAITSTPLSGLENLPILIPNPEARPIITNPLRTWATEMNQRQRQGQLELQAVSTPWSVVSGSKSIYQCRHSEITRLVFATGRLLELCMWHRQPLMSATNFEIASNATQRIAKSLAEAPHWKIIETYWNTAM